MFWSTFSLVFVFLFVIIISFSTIRMIRQSYIGIVERLGRFHKKAEVGINILIPFVDNMRAVVNLMEHVLDFPPQPVITKDNVTMQIDTVVYYRITDPIKYVYEIANPLLAIENLTATTLRNIIGDLNLDQTLTSRDTVNDKLRIVLDEATDPWGIRINRVELKNIIPPRDIQDAMEKEMRAERQKRAAILNAEGEKQAAILTAEGLKQSTILQAEAQKEANIRQAEGIKEASILKAQGEAEAIIQTQQAKAEGIKFINNVVPTSQVLTLRSIEALEKISEGDSTKLIIPSEAVGMLGSIKGIKEVLSDK